MTNRVLDFIKNHKIYNQRTRSDITIKFQCTNEWLIFKCEKGLWLETLQLNLNRGVKHNYIIQDYIEVKYYNKNEVHSLTLKEKHKLINDYTYYYNLTSRINSAVILVGADLRKYLYWNMLRHVNFVFLRRRADNVLAAEYERKLYVFMLCRYMNERELDQPITMKYWVKTKQLKMLTSKLEIKIY